MRCFVMLLFVMPLFATLSNSHAAKLEDDYSYGRNYLITVLKERKKFFLSKQLIVITIKSPSTEVKKKTK